MVRYPSKHSRSGNLCPNVRPSSSRGSDSVVSYLPMGKRPTGGYLEGQQVDARAKLFAFAHTRVVTEPLKMTHVHL
ncbi:gsr1058 [Gloeobacter violaceus PCC 7421]|uniref:Gsr1058 protein n=1 Tax=Gloeobacter violaceus (strain ATCC 29082 / PCC 7421) TaxID=251221 RepID=Q7NLR3_GLOVI|nr:gsr1058 [Gloeobacter violaceus PCC 7421]